MQQIASILQETLEPNATVRRAAEGRLRDAERSPGYVVQVLQLVLNDQCPSQVRMSAAVALKNFVKRQWGGAPEVEMSNEDEASFRQMLLDALFQSRGNIQEILSHALHLIAQRDFPKKWPELVPYLSKYLVTDSFDHIVATLTAMDQIFRKFRYSSKCTELWVELKHCLVTTQEPLTGLLGNMMQVVDRKDSLGADEVAQWLKILSLIAKVYHSLCSQDIPEYFEDNISPWMESFLVLIEVECPSQQSNSGEPTTLDELKTEICEIFTLYMQRYEEEIHAFVPRIIAAIWKLLESTGSETRYDTLVCSALEFLSIVGQKFTYEQYFTGEGVLKNIAENVCVRNLHLRQEDLEMFEDEALDYMKRDLEGTDVGTRRRGAIDLVRSLCRKFEVQLLPCLSNIVQVLISEGSFLKLDVVYCLVTAMASKAETSKAGVTATNPLVNVADFFSGPVRQHITSGVDETPILKADAMKFVVTFRNQLPPEMLLEALNAANQLLGSSTVILHKYAAYAIDKILLVQDHNTKKPIFNAQVLPVASILGNLVGAFDKDPKSQNSPYLIKAILRVITILDDETMKHADSIATKLAQLVESATKNPADSVHTHFLFETICVLVTKTKTVGGSLDSQLMPLIEVIFAQDLEDLIPYALQITGVLLSACIARNSSIDTYHNFLPFLLSEKLWARSANVPAALAVLEVFLGATPDKVLAEHSKLILHHYVRLVSSRVLDQHGFQLLTALLPHLEKITGVENPISVIFNNIFKRIQGSKTPKLLKGFIVFLSRYTIDRSADDLVKAVESIQSGMFQMLMEKVVVAEMGHIREMTTESEQRIIAIGMANIIGEVTQYITPIFGALCGLVAEIMEAAASSEKTILSPDEEQEAMYNAEGEFVNPFCRLSYAPKAAVVAPQIQNYKAYFAQAVLVRGPQKCSTVLSCVPENLITYLKAISA